MKHPQLLRRALLHPEAEILFWGHLVAQQWGLGPPPDPPPPQHPAPLPLQVGTPALSSALLTCMAAFPFLLAPLDSLHSPARSLATRLSEGPEQAGWGRWHCPCLPSPVPRAAPHASRGPEEPHLPIPGPHGSAPCWASGTDKSSPEDERSVPTSCLIPWNQGMCQPEWHHTV